MDYGSDNTLGSWNKLGDRNTLGDSNTLGYGNTLGNSNTLGSWNKLGDSNTLGSWNTLGDDNALGSWNTLGDDNALGDRNKLGDDNALGHRNTLGSGLTHGERLTMEGVKVIRLMCLSNVDGSGRQVQIIVHTEGVLVRAGCFKGTVEEFCAKALGEGKECYALVIRAAADTLQDYVKSKGLTGGWPTTTTEEN